MTRTRYFAHAGGAFRWACFTSTSPMARALLCFCLFPRTVRNFGRDTPTTRPEICISVLWLPCAPPGTRVDGLIFLLPRIAHMRACCTPCQRRQCAARRARLRIAYGLRWRNTGAFAATANALCSNVQLLAHSHYHACGGAGCCEQLVSSRRALVCLLYAALFTAATAATQPTVTHS